MQQAENLEGRALSDCTGIDGDAMMTPRTARWVHGCALLLLSTAAAARPVLHDTDLVCDQRLVRGAPATAYVAVKGALDLDTHEPLGDAAVTLVLEGMQASWTLTEARTDTAGHAALAFRVPAAATPGRYDLVVRTRSPHGEETLRRGVKVVDRTVLHLRTDRGLYRPGQTLHWRATVMNGADARPVAGATVRVQLSDPRGTAMWRGDVTTDATGMISGRLPLGEDLVLGKWQIEAQLGEVREQQKFDVQDFRLPAFEVALRPEGELVPGGPFRGHAVARYAYGEPVAGAAEVWVDGQSLARGALDAHGRLPVALPARTGERHLRAMVTDGAGRRETATLTLPGRPSALSLAIVPERTPLAPGLRQHVTVVASDGERLVPGTITLRSEGLAPMVQAAPGGVARFAVPVPVQGRLVVRAELEGAEGGSAGAAGHFDVGGAPRIVRPAQAVVPAGAAFEVTGHWPDARGTLVATLLRDGTPLTSAPVTVDASGRLQARLEPPVGAFGLATVRVARADTEPDGSIRVEQAAASVFLRPRRLDVRIAAGQRYRPGERAPVPVEVRGPDGEPVAGAGLAASVVDERVLQLRPPPPDLVEALHRLAAGHAEAAGLRFADLLLTPEDPHTRAAMEAIVEALPPAEVTPLVRLAAAERRRAERDRMARVESALLSHLQAHAPVLGRFDARGWHWHASLDRLLADAGWAGAERHDPWGQPTEWSYAETLWPALGFTPFSGRLAEVRLDALESRLAALGRRAERRLAKAGLDALVTDGELVAALAEDPWGAKVRVERRQWKNRVLIDLVAPGPDGKPGTPDDRVREDVFRRGPNQRGYGSGGLGMFGRGAGGGGVAYGRGGAAMGARPAPVRTRFDETVLWAVGVPTDAAGRATLDVHLADSLTGWRIAVEALGPQGGVGAATARLETFLPLQVEADLPPRLSEGDRYTLPVVLANHSGAQKSLRVRLQVSGGLTLDGADGATAELPDGATTALPFHLVATRTGPAAVQITLLDAGVEVDAVRRALTIDARGRPEARVYAASDRGGAAEVTFTAPADAAPGTLTARLRIYRGVADQALDGLETLLREPHGCFEQTSSATYPNLLVLRLLQDRPGTGPIADRARDLVAKGYQRLVSYEVPGGGFSWFGDAPANQVLTAYGLLEFVDMARVYPVDDALIDRTRRWLLSKQRSDGAWAPDASWLHDWSAVQGEASTTAWIAWALAEAGGADAAVRKALGFLRKHRGQLAKQPYLLALWAAAEEAARRKGPLDLLRKHQRRDPEGLAFGAGGKTLFYAGGRAADVQVTALAVPALARTGAGADARAAWDWVWAARDARGWGSTQGTVMALRAAAEIADAAPRQGQVVVRLDGREIARLDLDAGADVPQLDLPALAAGGHTLTLTADPPAPIEADLRLGWRSAAAPTAIRAGLEVALSVPAEPVPVRGQGDFAVQLRNPGSEVVAMPTLVVPVPPGFRAVTESLDGLKKSGRVARFEDVGSAIHLYLTRLDAGAEVALPYALEALAACDVLQRGPEAYAYYDAETRGVAAATRLRAVAEAEPVR